jgi:hypothetical protein
MPFGVSVASDGGPLGMFLAMIVALVLVASWVILAASRFVQGGVVERPERVPQLYGYTVCLVALIWGLTSLVSVVDDVLSLSAPEMRGYQDYGWEASVTSFEAFRMTYDRARRMTAGDQQATLDSVPEPELRRRYDALRGDRTTRGRIAARREITNGVLSLAICVGLFAFHWRWLRRRTMA